MEEKREYCCGTKREAKERDFGDENMHTVLFTAGTALVVAFLKRFVIMMFFIEQWRVWVFLLLNLVLLAIFFTSMRPSTAHDQSQQSEENAIKRKKPQRRGCGPESGKGDHQGTVKVEKVDHKCEEKMKKKIESINEDGANHATDEKDYDDDKEEEEEEEEEGETPRLSKEELNERVEAFIATFRRQLVSDAIRGRRDHYHSCFSKKKMIRENINGGFIKLERKEVF